MQCANCGTENTEVARFCRRCGQALSASRPDAVVNRCPQCDWHNAPAARFCSRCGHAMASAAASQQTPAPAPAVVSPAVSSVESGFAGGFAAAESGAATLTLDAARPRAKTWLVAGLATAVLTATGAGGYLAYQATTSKASTQAAPSKPAATDSAFSGLPAVRGGASPPVAQPAPSIAASRSVANPSADASAISRPGEPDTQPPSALPSEPVQAEPSNPPPDRGFAERRSTSAPPATPAPARPRLVPALRPTHPAQPVPPLARGDIPAARGDRNWYMGLRAAMGFCRSQGSYVARAICEQDARSRFCGPGNHWGQVPECVIVGR